MRMSSKKLYELLKYHHVITFDTEQSIVEGFDNFVVPIDTDFSVVIKRKDLTSKSFDNIMRSMCNCNMYSLGLEGTRIIKPVIIVYYTTKDRVKFSLARSGTWEYAQTLAFKLKDGIIYDTETRTMLFIQHIKKVGAIGLVEIWGKVSEDFMISNFGRLKRCDGKMIKQDKRRFDFMDNGKRIKIQVADAMYKWYLGKEGHGKTLYEPLDFYQMNIKKKKEC